MKPYYDHGGITIYHGDCRDVLPAIRDESVDLAVTDPPYQLTLASSGTKEKVGQWGDIMNGAVFYAEILRELKRLTVNPQGAAWVFNSWRSMPVLARASYEACWPIESMLVWDKDWIGPGGPRGLRPAYELVALYVHPKFQIPDRGTRDIWTVPWSSAKPNGHPAEKPVALMQKLIRVTPARSVIDPFLGSGTTLAAAKALGVRGIGIEIEEKWCEAAAVRLQQEVLPA